MTVHTATERVSGRRDICLCGAIALALRDVRRLHIRCNWNSQSLPNIEVVSLDWLWHESSEITFRAYVLLAEGGTRFGGNFKQLFEMTARPR